MTGVNEDFLRGWFAKSECERRSVSGEAVFKELMMYSEIKRKATAGGDRSVKYHHPHCASVHRVVRRMGRVCGRHG